MNFPTLSRRPISEKMNRIDNIITTETDSNHVIRRARSTRHRHQWELTYDLLNETDAAALATFFSQVDLVRPFYWIDRAGVTQEVVFQTTLGVISPFPGWFKFDPIILEEV